MARTRKPRAKAAPKPENRREHERQPIRLKVVYKNARSLVTEYTTSVSKGGCQLRAKKGLPSGTRFVFEMYARDAKEPVEIEGQVVRSVPGPDGLFEIGVQYLASTEKLNSLQEALGQILAEHRFERARRHPRVPVNLIALDTVDPTRRYLIRDVSKGGVGLRLPNDEPLPPALSVGCKLQLLVQLENAPSAVAIRGEVVWSLKGRSGFTHAAVGVAFPVVGNRQLEVLDALVHLARPVTLSLALDPAPPVAGSVPG